MNNSPALVALRTAVQDARTAYEQKPNRAHKAALDALERAYADAWLQSGGSISEEHE